MRIILGVGGGIAAYKSCELASSLVKAGHEVFVVMTESAAQFIGPLTFRALTGNPVGIHATDEPMGPLSHVKMAHWADVMIVAPLTQNLLARLSLGLSSDLLTLIFQGFSGPVLVAPAMESEMWLSPQTQARLQDLMQDRAITVVGPNMGRLASGLIGPGRMAEPEEMLEALWALFRPKTLQGRSILITTGPTWEHFDPVRILTNPSTGTVGIVLARELSARGAEVLVIHGPRVQKRAINHVHYEEIVSARDMLKAVENHIGHIDTVIGAAAVSDFRPAHPHLQKQKKSQLNLTWIMETNPDIMAELGKKYHDTIILIGFAAETDDVVQSARDKLRRKRLDAIIANQVGASRGFGQGEYQAAIIRPEDDNAALHHMTKEQLASEVADLLSILRPKKGTTTNV
ncbi:bifunctional phosphopantothenoylcysteine decarboxylase/phosphopantothenate--cysteine ligase CoaBC [Sulfobacillus thermosulfidooxidans]|uniref:bifunctional phosphopantothenoylcysteine decarboxylase/phosphopantothenate--cysteine ligase CoaBC n=1 Tax=Sulfobacillus thermosulfidooxidans TaxID=28034 RepID=UPI0006B54A8E|nr:bifunctional phosphopantothenoylcysteine decarboxylase/phosphopantothenate--cysteine ligase CoaBC [Sulfobacillus thermosulfidooxidans]